MRTLRIVTAALAAVMWPGAVCAAEPGASVIVDVTRQVVLTNAELVAMAGAGAAFAAGGPGLLSNPAAPANRRQEAVAPVVWSLVLHAAKVPSGADLANLGEPLGAEVGMFQLGLAGGYREGAAGAVAVGDFRRIGEVWAGVSEGHAAAAVALMDGALTLGAGPRFLGLRLTEGGVPHDYFGAGAEAGAVFANWKDEWNAALTLRSGVSATPLVSGWGDVRAARLPPEVAAGLGWSNRSRLPDDGGGVPVRIVADVIVDAPVPRAVGLEGAMQGEGGPRGRWLTASPRAAAEVDVWRDRLRVRAGSYLEPSRSTIAGPRPHATGGFELRLFRLTALEQRLKLDLAWQVGVDYAPRYFHGAFLGLNVWQEGLVGGTYRRATPAPSDATAAPEE